MDDVRTIAVDYLARVEGEGAMYVKVRDGSIEDLRFAIFEPPRFFEAFLRGRSFREAPDITARICGICPVAYQMSSVHAIEDALGASVGGVLRDLRLMLYCGEWIESHGLHVYMLHAPDFLGYESAVHMAADHRELVEQGLRLKKAGNELVSLLGGREIHPVNVKVGGFYRAPSRRALLDLVPALEWARDAAVATTQWAAKLPMPDLVSTYDFVTTWHPTEYPMLGERIVSSSGLDIAAQQWHEHFEEFQVEHSTSLHARMREGGAYHVGPMARYALCGDKLTDLARQTAAEAGLPAVVTNPFQSIVVRSVELVHATDLALRLIDRYEEPERSDIDIEVGGGTGHGVSEAPRGLLYHRYCLAKDGTIADAQIVPPTSQNQSIIEDDLRVLLETALDLTDDELTWRLEQAIRNYDPCISCSCHFLNLEIDRG